MKRFLIGLLFVSTAYAQTPMMRAGQFHSLFLKQNGTVWVAGKNQFDYGQLGLGATEQALTPEMVMDESKFVAAGQYHSLVIKNDGTVWAWGNNEHGQLCLGDSANRNVPTQLPLTDVVWAGAGAYHSLFLLANGTVWACGANSQGQLGIGNEPEQLSPVQVPTSDVRIIATTLYHSVMVKNDGSVWTWGDNNWGQLGVGVVGGDEYTPQQVVFEGVVQMVSAGHGATFAVLADGTVWAWGNNTMGELGQGTIPDPNSSEATSLIPLQVSVLTDIVDVSAGDVHILAKNSAGQIYGWGFNQGGQLGNGVATEQSIATPVLTDLTSVSEISTSTFSSFALRDDGSVWAWGTGSEGQLGVGNTTNVNPSPVEVGDSADVVIDIGAPTTKRSKAASVTEKVFTITPQQDMEFDFANVTFTDSRFSIDNTGIAEPCVTNQMLADTSCQLRVVFDAGSDTGMYSASVVIPTPDTFSGSVLLKVEAEVTADNITVSKYRKADMPIAMGADVALSVDADYTVDVPAAGVLRIAVTGSGPNEPTVSVNGFQVTGAGVVAAPSLAGTMRIHVTGGDVSGWTMQATSYVGIKSPLDAVAPMLNAGSDVIAGVQQTLVLTATASHAVTYTWSQVSGPTAVYTTSGNKLYFTTPNVSAQTVYVFKVVGTDSNSLVGEDTVTVTVNPDVDDDSSSGGGGSFAHLGLALFALAAIRRRKQS